LAHQHPAIARRGPVEAAGLVVGERGHQLVVGQAVATTPAACTPVQSAGVGAR